jgi:hypothetical protein
VSDPYPLGGDSDPVDPVQDGGVEWDGETADQATPPEPERTYLELDDDVANRYVRVKVDGEDVEVPLQEALSGYSRTADYTRKTQELAQQRQAADYALTVERALRAQPAETLRLLAQQYGVELGSQQQGPATAPDPFDDLEDENPYLDPTERRLAQVERQNQALQQQWEQRQANEQLRASIGNIQQRYQLNENDVREVVQTALQRGMGPESFDLIWKNIAFDRATTHQQQTAARQAAANAQRQAAGANASQLIGNGGSATRAGTSPAPANAGPMTIADAYAQAERELRGS